MGFLQRVTDMFYYICALQIGERVFYERLYELMRFELADRIWPLAIVQASNRCGYFRARKMAKLPYHIDPDLADLKTSLREGD